MVFSASRLVAVLIVVLLVVAYGWYRYQQQYVTQDQMLTQIEASYTQQFCSVVYPNLSKCLTSDAAQCPNLVQTAIRPCLDNLRRGLNERIPKQLYKETHARVTECFEMNMRNEIKQNHLVPSQECRDMMS